MTLYRRSIFQLTVKAVVAMHKRLLQLVVALGPPTLPMLPKPSLVNCFDADVVLGELMRLKRMPSTACGLVMQLALIKKKK